MKTEITGIYTFGEFELDAGRRLLLKAKNPIRLNSKTFDLLLALIEHPGEILSKNELLDRVWAGQFVEENNLTVHVAALRKALGEKKGENRYLVTVPGKGYKFVAEIERADEAEKEIIIESRTISRVFVEEENADELGSPANSLLFAAPKRTAFFGRRRAMALLVIAVTSATFIWFFYNSYTNTPARPLVQAGDAPKESAPAVSRFFAAAGGIPQRVAISPDGKWIAYVARAKGQDAIWLGDLQQNTSIQITESSNRLHEHLVFAPDNKTVYFTARDDNHLQWTLMRVSILGGAVQDLITGVHSSITFSPDGRRMAFLRKMPNTDRRSVIVADAENPGNEHVLNDSHANLNIVGLGLAWAKNGNKIAVLNREEKGVGIWAIDAQTGAAEKLVETIFAIAFNLVWLPDGGGLLVNASQQSENARRGQIWLVSYPDGSAREIVRDPFNYLFYSLTVSTDNKVALAQTRSDPNISILNNFSDVTIAKSILDGTRIRSEGAHGLAIAPDGKILFTANNSGSRTIWEMNEDGTTQRQLTPIAPNSGDTQINVTPDNRFLIFESERTGAPEIWRANRDGSDLVQLTNGGGNSEPTVSPDGKWVIFTSRKNDTETLWRASIEGNASPEQITNERASWADVSPDGRYIACVWGKVSDALNRRIAVIPFAGGAPIKTFHTAKHAILYNRLRWSPDGKSIIYKDNIAGLWRQDLNRDKPEASKGFDETRVFHFAFSPATKKLIYSGGVEMREIVVIENFR